MATRYQNEFSRVKKECQEKYDLRVKKECQEKHDFYVVTVPNT